MACLIGILEQYLLLGFTAQNLMEMGFEKQDVSKAMEKVIQQEKSDVVLLDIQDKPVTVTNEEKELIFSKKINVAERLARAAVLGNLTQLQDLLEQGVDINSKDVGGISLLANAVMNRKANVVQFLLKDPRYKITGDDIEEVADLIVDLDPTNNDFHPDVQVTVEAFVASVTLEHLKGLNISLIQSIIPDKILNSLKLS